MRRGPHLASIAALFLALWPTSISSRILPYADLDGWYDDDHREAARVFATTCDQLDGSEWQPIGRLAPGAARSREAARDFFEILFRPIQFGDGPGLLTGYYEPERPGSLTRTPRFARPIYTRLPGITDGVPSLPRDQIEATGALVGQGLEIAWLDDLVEVFFLQVQGSGRFRLSDGRVLRVGYGGRNGHLYRSIGQELIARGTMRADQVSAQGTKAWVRANPAAGAALVRTNPSFFFRRLAGLAADIGPIGAMSRSVTTLRTLAVDPAFTPLGVPVWFETEGSEPMHRLMVAQDTGVAIKGPRRADIYSGTGVAAGPRASRVKDRARMMFRLPFDRAYAMLPEG